MKVQTAMHHLLSRCLLYSKVFANAADLVAADCGRMIAPAASYKAYHILHFRIAQSLPEVRHGYRGGAVCVDGMDAPVSTM